MAWFGAVGNGAQDRHVAQGQILGVPQENRAAGHMRAVTEQPEDRGPASRGGLKALPVPGPKWTCREPLGQVDSQISKRRRAGPWLALQMSIHKLTHAPAERERRAAC